MARRTEGRVTTSTLLTLINNASTFAEAVPDRGQAKDPVFHDYLYELMEKKALTPKDMILRTGIERSYFYHILNGVKHPGRNVALRIALSLGVTLQETNRLLRLAGASDLYPRIRRDAALIFCIQRKYTLTAANDFLISEGEEPLYREDSNA